MGWVGVGIKGGPPCISSGSTTGNKTFGANPGRATLSWSSLEAVSPYCSICSENQQLLLCGWAHIQQW